jgi:hypothetical protein
MIHLGLTPNELVVALEHSPFSSIGAILLFALFSLVVIGSLHSGDGVEALIVAALGIANIYFIGFALIIGVLSLVDWAGSLGAVNYFLAIVVIAAIAIGILGGIAAGMRIQKPEVTK